MRVAACFYGDVRASVRLADQLRDQGHTVDVYVHKKFTDPYPTDLAPRCCWLEEPRPINRPEGVSEEQMWTYWSLARLGKMVIQTEQKEGRYALVAFAAPAYLTIKLPIYLLDGEVHTLFAYPDRVAIGPSTDMQLYLARMHRLQDYVEKHPGEVFLDHVFASWCLGPNYVEDLR